MFCAPTYTIPNRRGLLQNRLGLPQNQETCSKRTIQVLVLIVTNKYPFVQNMNGIINIFSLMLQIITIVLLCIC